ncbi:2356_t:CDS:2, partial [Racocetra fulgida]
MSDKTKKVKVTIETSPEFLDKIMDAINSVKSNSVIRIIETDINLMKEFLEKIQTIFDENFKILSQEVNVRNPELKGYKYNPGIKVHEIDPAMIKDPALGSETDSRGKLKKVVKRIIKDGVEIACKKIEIPTEKAASEEYQKNIGNKYLDLLNWMAPEKMQKYKISVSGKSPKTDSELFPYTQKCEIFSFGMLLWELTYQSIPYKDDSMQSIIENVIAGKREKCKIDPDLDSENDLIQKNLIVIIEKDVRTSLEQLYIDISNLSKKVIPGKDPALLTINQPDGSHEDEESEFNDLYITDYSVKRKLKRKLKRKVKRKVERKEIKTSEND